MSRNRNYIVLHVDLFVRSMERALDFYCDKLGFSLVDSGLIEGPLARHVSNGTFDAVKLVLLKSGPGGAMIELQEFQPDRALIEGAPYMELRKAWFSILVPDLQDLIDKLAAQGIQPASQIFRVKLAKSRGCQAVLYRDPDGNDLEFLQLNLEDTTR